MDNQNQTCIRCEKSLPLSCFYKHSSMRNGFSKQCKTCAKEYSKKRLESLRLNPAWLEKERERCRKKEKKRIDILKTDESWCKKQRIAKRAYARKHNHKNSKPSTEKMKEYKDKNFIMFPEKRYSRITANHLPKQFGMHNHHWSYRPEHAKDIIQLEVKHHYLVHRLTIYDQERMMYRKLDGTLIDSRESAIAYYSTLKDDTQS